MCSSYWLSRRRGWVRLTVSPTAVELEWVSSLISFELSEESLG